MIRNFNNVFKMNGIKMRKTEHALAIKNIKDFFLSDVSMVDDFTQALLELAEAMPREPFSTQYIEELSSFAVDSGIFATIVSIFAQAGHTEILPYATTYLKKETVPRYQLKFAAAIALLGEESGYQ
ncbi:hypothetical protein EBR21_04815, partial [bacterium]|nr:hypothetical protein [bacterium]